jgi:hypothetical protein
MANREPRLVLRVLSVWRTLCKGSTPPRRSQIDPMLFGTDWASCLLIDLDPTVERSRLSYVGAHLRDPTWPALDRQMLSECREGTLLHAALSYTTRVLAKGVPISASGVVPHEGDPSIYRSILLPLADSGRIDGLLGAASLISAAEKEPLLQEHSLHLVSA